MARILFIIALLYAVTALCMYFAHRRKLRRLLRSPDAQAVHIVEVEKEDIR